MPGYFFFFGGYEGCRRFITSFTGKRDLNTLSTIIAGGVGGASLWIAIFPFDVIKSRMQIGHLDSKLSTNVAQKNTIQMLCHVAKNEGNFIIK